MARPPIGSVAVTGVGESAFERGAVRSLLERISFASRTAIDDAGILSHDIDGIIQPPGYVGWDELARNVGLTDIRFTAQMQIGGASSVGALGLAGMAIDAGRATNVLIPIGWDGYSALRRGSRGTGDGRRFAPAFFEVVRNYYEPHGLVSPAWWYAPYLNRYVELFNVPAEAAGAVAVASRRHANANAAGNAYLRDRPLSMDEYLTAAIIVDPLRLFDCALETDCAAAVVVSSADRAADGPHRLVRVLGVEEAHPDPVDEIYNRRDVLDLAVGRASRRLFDRTGVRGADIDVALLYDAFSHLVLMQLESIGFAEPGGAAEFVAGGGIELEGALPVNTHGGMLAQGHSWGMGHVIESVRQLRGAAGDAQVQGCEAVLVTGYGDLGDGTVAVMAAS